MKSDFFRVNIETGEFTEKVVLDLEDNDAPKSDQSEDTEQD